MTTPEQLLLARRRRQMWDEQTTDRLELDTPEREDSWVKDFIARLTGVIRNKRGKSQRPKVQACPPLTATSLGCAGVIDSQLSALETPISSVQEFF